MSQYAYHQLKDILEKPTLLAQCQFLLDNGAPNSGFEQFCYFNFTLKLAIDFSNIWTISQAIVTVLNNLNFHNNILKHLHRRDTLLKNDWSIPIINGLFLIKLRPYLENTTHKPETLNMPMFKRMSFPLSNFAQF